jgi:ATP-binding cassette subfamily B (MDR/TAP) protein 1
MSSSANGAAQAQEGGGKKKKAAEEVAKVPFLKLFSFADQWDCVLMAVGSLGACAHGASVPVFFIFFGKLINIIGLAYLFPTTVSGRVAKVINLLVYQYSRRRHARASPAVSEDLSSHHLCRALALGC